MTRDSAVHEKGWRCNSNSSSKGLMCCGREIGNVTNIAIEKGSANYLSVSDR